MAICDVVFESDSKIVSNAVLGNTTPPIAIASVIMGIQQQLTACHIRFFVKIL